jgi:hypothetical protein
VFGGYVEVATTQSENEVARSSQATEDVRVASKTLSDPFEAFSERQLLGYQQEEF